MMPLPKSFVDAGYLTPQQVVSKLKVMIGTEGGTNTGKSEFIFSAPGPGVLIAIDRNIDGAIYNHKPPVWRRDDWALDIVTVPKEGHEDQAGFKAYWKKFYNDHLMKAAGIPDVRAIGIDGDSDTWELQRLATFGKLTQVGAGLTYTEVNAYRRAMIARLHDSGKIVIATNKVTDEWIDKVGSNGQVELNKNTGRPVQTKSGEERRQGFSDYNYLWQIQLKHLFKPAKTIEMAGGKTRELPMQWGIRILKCKPNMELEGHEMWGSDCNFKSLVSIVYPHIDPEDWYK